MAEYIDRESAKRNILSLTVYDSEQEIKDAVKSARYKEDQWIGGIYDALVSLNEVYAADVIKVVRCKDCLLHGIGICRFEQYLGLDGYCSNAERRAE